VVLNLDPRTKFCSVLQRCRSRARNARPFATEVNSDPPTIRSRCLAALRSGEHNLTRPSTVDPRLGAIHEAR